MALPAAEAGVVQPGERLVVPCAVAIGLPPAFAMIVQPIVVHLLRHGVMACEGPGDDNTPPMVNLILMNTGTAPFSWRQGATLALGLIVPIAEPLIVEI